MALSGGHGFDLMYVNLKSHVFLPSRRYATLYLHILYILKDNIRIWLVLLIDPSHLYWCGYKRVVEQLLIASSSKKNPLKKVKCHAVTIWNCPYINVRKHTNTRVLHTYYVQTRRCAVTSIQSSKHITTLERTQTPHLGI